MVHFPFHSDATGSVVLQAELYFPFRLSAIGPVVLQIGHSNGSTMASGLYFALLERSLPGPHPKCPAPEDAHSKGLRLTVEPNTGLRKY